MKNLKFLLAFLLAALPCAAVQITGFGTGDFSVLANFTGSDSQNATSYSINGADSGNNLVGSIATPVNITGQTSTIYFTGTLTSANPLSAFQIQLYDSNGNGFLYNGNWSSFVTGVSSTVALSFVGTDGAFNGTVASIVLATSGAGSTIGFTLDNLATTASAIPEPSTYVAIFGAAALGFVVVRRRLVSKK